MTEVIIAVISGLTGGLIGPIIYNEYSSWSRERKWAGPRKKLLLKMLNDKKKRFKSIQRLTRTTGCSDDECRSLLIEIGARGALLKNGREGWALIERAPLREELAALENEEAEQ